MESLCNQETFLFIYGDISDKNPNLGHNIGNFWPRKFMIAKFRIDVINFKTKSKLDDAFNYNFRLLNVYLVKDIEPISILTKRKQGLDKMAISLLRIKKTIDQANLLRLFVPSLSKRKENL